MNKTNLIATGTIEGNKNMFIKGIVSEFKPFNKESASMLYDFFLDKTEEEFNDSMRFYKKAIVDLAKTHIAPNRKLME